MVPGLDETSLSPFMNVCLSSDMSDHIPCSDENCGGTLHMTKRIGDILTLNNAKNVSASCDSVELLSNGGHNHNTKKVSSQSLHRDVSQTEKNAPTSQTRSTVSPVSKHFKKPVLTPSRNKQKTRPRMLKNEKENCNTNPHVTIEVTNHASDFLEDTRLTQTFKSTPVSILSTSPESPHEWLTPEVKLSRKSVLDPTEDELCYLRSYALLNPCPDDECITHIRKRVRSASVNAQIRLWFAWNEEDLQKKVHHMPPPLQDPAKQGYRLVYMRRRFRHAFRNRRRVE